MNVRSALLFAWELPQNLLGGVTYGAATALGKVRRTERAEGRVFVESDGLGISLGLFVFYFEDGNRYFPPDPLMRRHEHGHTFQSRALGPLYLPLVGIPSSLRAAYATLYREVTGRRWPRYFDGYPERWADRLGGITPEERARQMQCAGADLG